jgi:hypothetical protein
LEENKFKLGDIFGGIIIPLILVLLVYVLAVYVNVTGTQHVLGETNTIAIILTQGFSQMIILGIPLVLGLLWNKWAGGAAGFIMGGLYYVASAGQYNGTYASYGVTTYNFFGDISLLMWILYGVIIGYMAGSLNNGSTKFKRMLGAGLTASVIVAILTAYINITLALEPARAMAQDSWTSDPVLAVIVNFVPGIALGIIVPILGKVMTWYGIQPMRH